MNLHFEALADGLATHGYAVVDQFLSQQEVDAILDLETLRDTGNLKRAGIGSRQSLQVVEHIRGDYIQWLDRDTAPQPVKVYLTRLDELMAFLNQSLFLSLKDFEAHFTWYPPGAFYKRHLDQFKYDDHRRLSVIGYLNKDWKADEGGQLRMYLLDQVLDVLPEAGRLVCFRSDVIEHEVLPATRERLSITGWMLDQLAALRYL
jgi:SM-20-related protein